MSLGRFHVPTPINEPVLSYAPGTPERDALHAELDRQAEQVVEIPCVIGGEHVYTGRTLQVTSPCDHQRVLANLHLAGPEEVGRAVDAAESAKAGWAALDPAARSAVLLKAASLLSGPWRARVNAATMLGQAKTPHQADIDCAAELCDFWRFNPYFAEQVYAEQPLVSPEPTWNRSEHRPLDGFVFAVSPFNFTSIALNLCTAPALMGNTVLWKPATTSALSCWVLMQLLEEAGMPPGVINLLNGHGADVGDPVLMSPAFAGLHFTGSTGTFQAMYKTIANNLEHYRCYPRIVGETGGKDFIVAHPSAHAESLAVAIVRGAFEFQGQKCSAASRIYVPQSLWPQVRDRVIAFMGELKMGDVRDLDTFIGAVIDERAFTKHTEYQKLAHDTATVLAGGGADRSTGWFVEPTLVQVKDPRHRLMQEEIFGPIVTAYVYPDDGWDEVLDLVDTTSPYGLTGALWARDRQVIEHAAARLRYAAGNFYINDKPTGAVVGQQPFGGARASGTNDKAGSPLNLLRWVNARTIKETFVTPTDWRYPYQG